MQCGAAGFGGLFCTAPTGCGTILISGQNSLPFTAPVGFGFRKTLPTTTPDTYDGALSQAARCSEGNRGFQIFQAMVVVNKVVPNEATFTSLARTAAAKEDSDMAFDLIKGLELCRS
ncbi:hypothetical protein SO802_021789 [Lithocarpus litseifolius]|uniref:PROP1-like PPR domain-containing protein n=1 Tax=Lithocarpus litseifolius TaxID=425828 RepID=A0AAW2CG75_9ROSI